MSFLIFGTSPKNCSPIIANVAAKAAPLDALFSSLAICPVCLLLIFRLLLFPILSLFKLVFPPFSFRRFDGGADGDVQDHCSPKSYSSDIALNFVSAVYVRKSFGVRDEGSGGCTWVRREIGRCLVAVLSSQSQCHDGLVSRESIVSLLMAFGVNGRCDLPIWRA